MRSNRRVVAVLVVVIVSTTSPLSAQSSRGHDGLEVAREIERVRSATAAFKSLDAAVAAGYSRNGGTCVQNQPNGAMGYHHVNESLLDDSIVIEQPEMLVYERLPDGTYRLNGVEYIVPFSVRPATAEPPTVMGQPLKPAPQLEIWYRHVWVWLDNPSGLFADWNPDVRCDGPADRTRSQWEESGAPQWSPENTPTAQRLQNWWYTQSAVAHDRHDAFVAPASGGQHGPRGVDCVLPADVHCPGSACHDRGLTVARVLMQAL